MVTSFGFDTRSTPQRRALSLLRPPDQTALFRELGLAISVAFLALALGAVAPSLAQDGGAFPFFYVVSSEIKPGMGSTYALAIAQVVAANKSSENGSNFATFVNVTGEGAVYNHFIAMQSLGEMDNLSLPGLLIAELGPEKGGQVLESLASSADSTTRVLKFMPQLSKMPSQPAMAPPPMVLHVGYQIPAESVAEFNQVAAKYVGATRENAKGRRGNKFPVSGVTIPLPPSSATA